MRHAAAARLFPSLGWLLLFATNPLHAAVDEPDQYEEKTVSRAGERAGRSSRNDRAQWVKELENLHPKRVGNPLKEDEYAVWFELVAGKGDEWRRDSTTNTPFAELFDKVVQRLELGPVPSIRREEFMKYARRVLVPANPTVQGTEANEEADKVFRVLDRDGDGVLSGDELTTKLREDKLRADVDGNGRIDKDEYRAHFQRRVATSAEAFAKANEQNVRGSDSKPVSKTNKTAFPDWFTELDADKDGQIALAEWRKAGRAINLFMEMDLDGDGLLTKEDYLRFVRLKEREAEVERLSGAPMMEKRVMK